jgi:aspartate racemase
MEQHFYIDRLKQQGLEVLLPEREDRDTVHRIIFEELCLGQTLEVSRQHYRRIMAKLVEQGAQSIILGCTEITLLVGAADAGVPLFDTTALHASAAAAHALA